VGVGTVLIKAGTVEQQLDQLRQSIDAVKKSIGDVNDRVGHVERDAQKRIEDESAERQLTDLKLGELIEQQKIGDVHIQIAGLALLLISIFMANAPTESSLLLRFLGLGHRAYW
jgi:TolA-binding protein